MGDFTGVEIDSLLSIIIYLGINFHQQMEEYWSKSSIFLNPFIAKTMGENRIYLLLITLHKSDISTEVSE